MRMLRAVCYLALLAMTAYPVFAESHWIRLKSTNFELYSSAGPRSARDTIREFEQVRDFFLQAFKKPPANSEPVRLVAFGSSKEYEPYRLNEFATTYYHQTPGRDYIVMGQSGADTFPVAVHEYVHLLMRHYELKFPPWLNEGMAELYSTLRPLGGKILVGDLIPGRYRALREEKWVPLATILSAGHDSPYYNEKNKAGSLYNEGWALTHMLHFGAAYRAKFPQLLVAISGGEDSGQALVKVYGRSVEQIEKDLQAYLRGTTFQGELFAAKLEKVSEELPVESLADFDTQLMFADLMYRHGKEAEQRAIFEQLARQDPKRPESYRGLGYLDWRDRRHKEATEQFRKAYDLGDRDPGLLWDYGRLLEPDHRDEAIRVLTQLLAQQSARVEVRLELAELHLSAGKPSEALDTLQGIRTVTPADAPRFFRLAVYAHLRNDDQKSAVKSAQRFREFAKTEDDRSAADSLIKLAEAGSAKAAKADFGPVAVAEGDRPHLQRAGRAEETPEAPSQAPVRPGRPTVSGRFVELDCRGKQARMILETQSGRQAFLIDVPNKVAIVAGSNGPVDMTCGPQKTAVTVEVGYDPAPPNQGVDGLVRTVAF